MNSKPKTIPTPVPAPQPAPVTAPLAPDTNPLQRVARALHTAQAGLRLTSAEVLTLQRTVGNRAVASLFTPPPLVPAPTSPSGVIQRGRNKGKSKNTTTTPKPTPNPTPRKSSSESSSFSMEEEDKPEVKADALRKPIKILPGSSSEDEGKDMELGGGLEFPTTSLTDIPPVETMTAAEALEQEEDEEEEQLGPQKFWARAVVRVPAHQAKLLAAQVTVTDFSISPQRHETLYGREKGSKTLQGAHLIAWLATLQHWNAQLEGPLDECLSQLEEWILADQIADDDRYAENTPRRGRALYLVTQLQTQPLKLDTILDYYEEAVSLFVSTNQFSSFATYGKSYGGNAEADSLNKLSLANEKAGEEKAESGTDNTPDVHMAEEKKEAHLLLTTANERVADGEPPTAVMDVEKKDTPQTDDKGKTLGDVALRLVDLKHKNLDETTTAKVIYTWYHTILDEYPDIEATLANTLKSRLIKKKTVQEWLDSWTAIKSKKEPEARKQLTEAYDPEKDTTFIWKTNAGSGVRAIAKPTIDTTLLGDNPQVAAADVLVREIDIPERLRAPTFFGNVQQSHVIAWTFERQSLILELQNKRADKVLEHIYEKATYDRKSMTKRPPANPSAEFKTILDRSIALGNRLAEITSMATCTVDQWMRYINEVVMEYIEVKQGLPISTYSGAGNAEGHGEGASNKKVKKLREAELKNIPMDASAFEMRNTMVRYMDTGFMYVPFLNLLNRASDIAKTQRTLATERQGKSKEKRQKNLKEAGYSQPKKRLRKREEESGSGEESKPKRRRLNSGGKYDSSTAKGSKKEPKKAAKSVKEPKKESRKAAKPEKESKKASKKAAEAPTTAIKWITLYLDTVKIPRFSTEQRQTLEKLSATEFGLMETFATQGETYLNDIRADLKKTSYPGFNAQLLKILDDIVNDLGVGKIGSLCTRIKTIREELPRRKALNSEVKNQELDELAQIQAQLAYPDQYVKNTLVPEQEWKLHHVMGDFRSSMASFHPPYHSLLNQPDPKPEPVKPSIEAGDTDMGEDEKAKPMGFYQPDSERSLFLTSMLHAPLNPKETRIGGPIESHLAAFGNQKGYMSKFTRGIDNAINETWSYSAFGMTPPETKKSADSPKQKYSPYIFFKQDQESSSDDESL